MAWDATRDTLLQTLGEKIDRHADAVERTSLHNLAAAMYGRFPAEDMRLRSVEDLYGCLCGMLRFMHCWDAAQAKVEIFNPEVENNGWESHYTTIAVLCRAIPFCTASVRGELNRRNLMVHTIISADLGAERNAQGLLQAVLPAHAVGEPHQYEEALLFFEIERFADPLELEDLRSTLVEILEEVDVVVADFPRVCERLQDAANAIKSSSCIERSLREEAMAFLAWMEHDHMTLLGYEYLAVNPPGSPQGISVNADASLGLLRQRSTRGPEDLAADLASLSREELLHKQLSFSKSRTRSRVHRSSYPDYVEVREYDAEGRVVGQHRFIGLYTSLVYNTDPRNIPILRRKFERVLDMSAQDWSEHESRELVRTLQVFPRDELFQSSIEQLCATVNAVNRIQERRQIRVFVRRDVHGKFINCLVYLPRDHYRTELREKIEAILRQTFRAEELEFNTFYSESILVRVHFVMQVDPAVPLNYDIAELQSQIEQATLSWEDRLRLRLLEELGDEAGEAIFRRIGRGFAPGYQDDFDPRVAVMDIRKLRRLLDGDPLAMSLYRLAEEGPDTLRLRLYHPGQSLPLSDVLPILENLGLRVLTERPYEVLTNDGLSWWVQEFGIVYGLEKNIVVREVKAEFEDAFGRIWFGEAENDGFNRLLLGTRMNWREVAMLRAYARYLRQLQFPFSVEYMAETMANHLHISAGIVELFLTRLSPAFQGDDDWRAQREKDVEQRVLDALEQVENLGEDRIIRQYLSVVKATLRTNFFQQSADGSLKSYFSFKLSPADIPGVPRPVPMFEIFVYSPRVEGVHLRGGRVARGGLRWSDRQEDFRTEVLGLVKAQQVKNAVIVPVGAKGGFVARQLTAQMQRGDVQREGEACYQIFIRGLLDITDNRVETSVVHPPMVVARDEEDPYLVVAADKGTATFSDIANGIANEYDFWLGDAFASGGSAGYDHKKMGITARGAWESVKRHFREMGKDIQTRDDITVVGIGDMSG
ncbi:MAG: NAD-glutamate dehydrogenase, partial [Halioglobus sp.]|nr:NAD-glutamate dehydrogenase [Halioglobus sp.]